MNNKKILMQKLIWLVVLVLVAVVSFTLVSKAATDITNFAETIKTLDNKKMAAMSLSASVAGTSTLLAAVPGDATTPIANQISELTFPLLLVVCAIYLEKFLLTTVGYVSFRFLIPIACILGIIYLFYENDLIRNIAIKMATFAIVVFLIIPTSVKTMDLIDKTFEQSITNTFEKVENIEIEETTEEKNWFESFVSGVSDTVSNVGEGVKNVISLFIDAIAILIITTCIIPIAIIFFATWLIKLLFGINISIPKTYKKLKSDVKNVHTNVINGIKEL